MLDGAPAPTPDDADAPAGGGATPRPRVERQLEALDDLVGIGLGIARAIGRQVDEAAGPQTVADLDAAALAYARVARAVRQTVMLQDRLQAEQGAATAKAGDLRSRVTGIVRRAIEAEHDGAEQPERLAAEAAERLEREDYGDILTRPIREIVAAICKDLGLDPDWPSLEDDISAAEGCARGAAGDPGAPAPGRTGPIEIFWMDDHGRPTPAPAHQYTSRLGRKRPYDPSCDTS